MRGHLRSGSDGHRFVGGGDSVAVVLSDFGEAAGALSLELVWVVEGKLVVGKIWTKEIKNKINIGDPIVSINGMRTAGMTICDVLMKSPLDTLMKATIEVKTKSGEVQMVEIAKH